MSQNLPAQSKQGAQQYAEEETERKKAWLKWAKGVLGLKKPNDDTTDFRGEYRQGSQLDKLHLAATRDELKAIKFDEEDLAVIEAINNILSQKRAARPRYFEDAKEGMLRNIIRGRFDEAKKFFRKILIKRDEERAAGAIFLKDAPASPSPRCSRR